jgi:hypothetical protein
MYYRLITNRLKLSHCELFSLMLKNGDFTFHLKKLGLSLHALNFFNDQKVYPILDLNTLFQHLKSCIRIEQRKNRKFNSHI